MATPTHLSFGYTRAEQQHSLDIHCSETLDPLSIDSLHRAVEDHSARVGVDILFANRVERLELALAELG